MYVGFDTYIFDGKRNVHRASFGFAFGEGVAMVSACVVCVVLFSECGAGEVIHIHTCEKNAPPIAFFAVCMHF